MICGATMFRAILLMLWRLLRNVVALPVDMAAFAIGLYGINGITKELVNVFVYHTFVFEYFIGLLSAN